MKCLRRKRISQLFLMSTCLFFFVVVVVVVYYYYYSYYYMTATMSSSETSSVFPPPPSFLAWPHWRPNEPHGIIEQVAWDKYTSSKRNAPEKEEEEEEEERGDKLEDFYRIHERNLFELLLLSSSSSLSSLSPSPPSSSSAVNSSIEYSRRPQQEGARVKRRRISRVSYNEASVQNGYANRLYSLLSSLVVAVLADTALVVHWPCIDEYIRPPINIFYVLHKSKNNSNRTPPPPSKSKSKSAHSYWSQWSWSNQNENEEEEKEEEAKEAKLRLRVHTLQATQAWTPIKNVTALMHTRLPRNLKEAKEAKEAKEEEKEEEEDHHPYAINRYFYRREDAYFMELCANPANYDKLLAYDLVSPHTIREAKKRRNGGGGGGGSVLRVGLEVAGHLLNRVWLPVAHLQRQIDAYVSEHFLGYLVIGMHVRFGDPDLPYLERSVDPLKFIRCAIQIENRMLLLQNQNRNRNRNNSTTQRTTKQIKWFVASDSQSHVDALVAEYGPHKVLTTAHLGKEGKEGKEGLASILGHVRHDERAYARAILDVELLAKCDELILTGGSTFGFLAAIKQQPLHLDGRLPYFVNGFEPRPHSSPSPPSPPSHTTTTTTECQRMRLNNDNDDDDDQNTVPKTPQGFAFF